MSGQAPVYIAVITGPVGVGKTTMVAYLAELLAERGLASTAIDMDWLRASWPRPAGDQFNVALGYRNLADVARNSRETGVRRFVIADVVETREQRERYREAIPGAEVMIVRLIADIECIRERIGRRAGSDPDPWEPARVAELVAIMDANDVADVMIDTTGRTPRDVTTEVLAWLGWV